VPTSAGRLVTAPHTLTPEQYRAAQAAAMTEAALQARVLAHARALGWLAYHTHDSRRSQPGFPDLVLVSERRARVLYRELKTERGRLSGPQSEWLRVLRVAGADAAVWRPMDLMTDRVLHDLMTDTSTRER
jgi:hypothetical protein